MTDVLVDSHSLPAELRPYLEGLVRRTRAVCGGHLISVFAVGSIALGDYRHGRSDVDVTIVAEPSIPARVLRELAESLAHPSLHCPAAGLELVVYGADFIAEPSGAAGYLMDLNTGPMLPNRVSFDPAESSGFWYVIDRSIAHQDGRLLHGTPVRQVLAAPSERDLYAAMQASVREHAGGAGHLGDNRVLNGCRTVAFCRTGRWLAKREAAQLIATSEQHFRPLVETALHSFQRPRSAALPLPASDVRTFLTWVGERVDEAATRAAVGGEMRTRGEDRGALRGE
ncbi:aminoglycoside adenylyltransferase domain-containing protein [Nocardia arthritidis]|uniref:aminoglycoside adenylyltransferase domain-containing protein n=1 Tax=Nocardia arthritidis TaxID=228602 RepID=UPI0007A4B7C2|nr:aminoglycoside adenylyltransferase domain-containing protein [Nocardia arthritidis]